MKRLAADIKKHLIFIQVAKINKKVFLPNLLNDFLTLPIRFIILCVVWFAIFKALNVEVINSFSVWGMILYYFVFSVILQLTMYYRQLPYVVWSEITKGDMSRFICRPISYIRYHFFYGLGYTFYSSIICVPAIIIFSLFFLSGIDQLLYLLLSIVSIIGGIVVTFYIYINIGLLTFWTESIFGYRDLILHLGAIFAGSIIPLSFMPKTIQNITMFLPFRYTVFESVCILTRQYFLQEAIFAIVRQCAMIIFLSIFTKVIWKYGINMYEAQGG